jgi:hypothetical protein
MLRGQIREGTMRLASLAMLLTLAACASVPGDLPAPRYADAASRGALASVLAGRPSADQVERAGEKWSEALGDSFACKVPARAVIDAGLVGALDMAAMNAAASGGGQREIRAGVGRFVAQLAVLAVQQRAHPADARCRALAAWAPRTAAAGREAVERARRNGLMEDNYGLLLDLLAR